MGKVIVTFRIMPKGIEVDLEELEERVRKEIGPERMEREPIAFGLVAIKATKLVEEESGELEREENKIRGIEGVGEVEIVEITRSI